MVCDPEQSSSILSSVLVLYLEGKGLLRMCFLNNSTFFVLQGRYADKVFGIPMLKQYYSDYSFDRLSQSLSWNLLELKRYGLGMGGLSN